MEGTYSNTLMKDFTNNLEENVVLAVMPNELTLWRVASLWHWFELAIVCNLKCMCIMGSTFLGEKVQLKFFYRLQCIKVICKEMFKRFHRTLNITVIATRRHCWCALKWILLSNIPMHLSVFYVFSCLLILEISNQGNQHEKIGNGKCYAGRRCLEIAY